MKDINAPLRKKLYEMLQPVVDVIVYNGYVPSYVQDNAYILIKTINNNDCSTMGSHDTITRFKIGIYTRDTQANSGAKADELASLIYQTIYPTGQPLQISLEPSFQLLCLRLLDDVPEEPIETNNFVFINRFITFRVLAYHRA